MKNVTPEKVKELIEQNWPTIQAELATIEEEDAMLHFHFNDNDEMEHGVHDVSKAHLSTILFEVAVDREDTMEEVIDQAIADATGLEAAIAIKKHGEVDVLLADESEQEVLSKAAASAKSLGYEEAEVLCIVHYLGRLYDVDDAEVELALAFTEGMFNGGSCCIDFGIEPA